MSTRLSISLIYRAIILPIVLAPLCFSAKPVNMYIHDGLGIPNESHLQNMPFKEAISINISDSSMSINGKFATQLISNQKDHALDFPDSSWNASYSKHVSSALVGRSKASVFITPRLGTPYVLLKPILRSIANARINTASFISNQDTITTEIYLTENTVRYHSHDPDSGFTRLMITSDSLWVCYGKTSDEFNCSETFRRPQQPYSERDFKQIDSILSASRPPKIWIEIDPHPMLQFDDLSLVMKWLSQHKKLSITLRGALN